MKKSSTLAKEKRSENQGVADIRQWMKDHEKDNNRRFKQGADTMRTLATKDDLSIVMLDQASKTDVAKLTKLLLTEDGQPKFATQEQLAPVIAIYQGGVFTKSLVLGAAAVIGAIVGIGWGLITLVQWFTGHGTPTPNI